MLYLPLIYGLMLMDRPGSVIQVQNLTHRYGDRVALSNVSFEVSKGEIFGLLGPNGGGKSTLFRILSTMMVPTEGRAIIAGHDVERDPAAVRRQVGVVFQTQSLDKALTVEENLRAQGHLHGLSGATLRDRMEAAMERWVSRTAATTWSKRSPAACKRRVEIAKALLHRPQGAADGRSLHRPRPGRAPRSLAARRELREQEGVTILLTTHILEEADRCDRLVLLHQGNIVAQGSPGELRSRIGGDVVVLETGDSRGAGRDASQQRFGLEPSVMDGQVRVEIANGHRFITEVVEAFPGAIESVGLHKPTLEDVSCAKQERRLNSFILPAATLWQRELVRFWRQKSRVMGVVASPLVFWLLIGYGLERSRPLLLRVAGADGDVLRDLLDDLDHRGPPRRLSALDDGLARAAHQPGAGQDPGLGHTGVDPGPDLSLLRAAGRSRDRSSLDLIPIAAAIFLISLHPDRPRLRDRLADGIHRRLPRHHEPAAGADVDGLGLAVPHGDRARLDHGDHVGQPADLLDRAAQSHAAPAQRRRRARRRV